MNDLESILKDSLAYIDKLKSNVATANREIKRMRKVIWSAHNSADPSVRPCKCFDCNAHATAAVESRPRASRSELEQWDNAMGHGQTDET